MHDSPAEDIAPSSYATAKQQLAYIEAMRRISEARQQASPVRVYVCAPPTMVGRPAWEQRLDRIRHRLPDADLLQFNDLFTPENYAERWPEVFPSFDGMVVVAPTKRGRSHGFVYRLGEIARLEVIDVVRSGRPVLLHARRLGLVPMVDCKISRTGVETLRTKVTVPAGWDPRDYEPTLHAALKALRPRDTKSAKDRLTRQDSMVSTSVPKDR
ncbi:hypothetical protein [Streptomyces sp. NBC_00687]|uniref:hypothetical protein n=1 Tax=Streptomyces sp. NBC_00687 TaxID=2975807 RepID=UPI00224EAB66|nr:hypothetical protein [Streptomyces sp. NBC_00687]MCX4919955.1 hypothetical protein [Streptomyces sp. NBC_00687]